MTESVFSIKTGKGGARCFALMDGNTKMCYHEKCLNTRNISVGSTDCAVSDFSCEHISKIQHNSSPKMDWKFNQEMIDNYPCDTSTKSNLQLIFNGNQGNSLVFQVATKVFVVYSIAGTTAHLGFVHLYGDGDDKNFRCGQKNCNLLMGSGKQVKSRKICIHQHVLLCALFPESSKQRCSESPVPSTTTNSLATQNDPYVYIRRASTISANLNRKLPYTIPLSVLQKAQQFDAATLLNDSNLVSGYFNYRTFHNKWQ